MNDDTIPVCIIGKVRGVLGIVFAESSTIGLQQFPGGRQKDTYLGSY